MERGQESGDLPCRNKHRERGQRLESVREEHSCLRQNANLKISVKLSYPTPCLNRLRNRQLPRKSPSVEQTCGPPSGPGSLDERYVLPT